jgi:hypothetical protein
MNTGGLFDLSPVGLGIDSLGIYIFVLGFRLFLEDFI